MISLSSLLEDEQEAKRFDALLDSTVPREELEFLYGLVRILKPILVLEASTGSDLVATAVACALEANGHGAIWSFGGGETAGARCLSASLGVGGRIQKNNGSLDDFLRVYRGAFFDLVVVEAEAHQEALRLLKANRVAEGLLILRGASGRSPVDGQEAQSCAPLGPGLTLARLTR